MNGTVYELHSRLVDIELSHRAVTLGHLLVGDLVLVQLRADVAHCSNVLTIYIYYNI